VMPEAPAPVECTCADYVPPKRERVGQR
jgi:hypothetical protein